MSKLKASDFEECIAGFADSSVKKINILLETSEVGASYFDKCQIIINEAFYVAFLAQKGGMVIAKETINKLSLINKKIQLINEKFDQEILKTRKIGDITEASLYDIDSITYYETMHELDDNGETFWKPFTEEGLKRLGYDTDSVLVIEESKTDYADGAAAPAVPDGRGGMYTINPLDVEAAAAAGAASSSDSSSHKLVGEAPEDGCCHCCTVS